MQDIVPGFGQRLKEVREQKGLTLKDAGELIGIPGTQLSSYENDKHNVSSSILLAIATAYGVSADHLLGLGGGAGSSEEMKDFEPYAKVIFQLNKLSPHLFNDAVKNLSAYIRILEGSKDPMPKASVQTVVPAVQRTETPPAPPKKPGISDIFADE